MEECASLLLLLCFLSAHSSAICYGPLCYVAPQSHTSQPNILLLHIKSKLIPIKYTPIVYKQPSSWYSVETAEKCLRHPVRILW